jgi:hypothetical protein
MLIMVDDKTTRAGLLAKNSHPTSEGILNICWRTATSRSSAP